MMVEVRGLRKCYDNQTAVEGLSFSVGRGEIFGLLGPNGAGKTTTMKMLSTLVRPSGGRAAVNGFDIAAEPLKVRACIGLVFQEPSLDYRLTARENLYMHALLYGMRRSMVKAAVGEALAMVGLEERADDLVRTFSGGMRRRLELGRALMHNPPVLFLDEPTVGLDPQTRHLVWDYIRRLKEERKVTIFLTTHYMDEAENCDRIAVIDHGRVAALDTPAVLKERFGMDPAKGSLDDVFLRITGRSIRNGGSRADSLQVFTRMRGGR